MLEKKVALNLSVTFDSILPNILSRDNGIINCKDDSMIADC